MSYMYENDISIECALEKVDKYSIYMKEALNGWEYSEIIYKDGALHAYITNSSGAVGTKVTNRLTTMLPNAIISNNWSCNNGSYGRTVVKRNKILENTDGYVDILGDCAE